MWWNLLVARFYKPLNNITTYLIYLIISITHFFNWSICNRQMRWRCSSSYPAIWMILSAMMLNAHFVNAMAGLSVHQTFTPSHQNAIISDPTMWLPPRKPPDKLRYTCRIKTANQLKTQSHALDTSQCNKSDVTWQVNSTNVTYSTQNTGLRTRKGALVD